MVFVILSSHMPKEQEGLPLTSIHINLNEGSIEFEDEHGTVARLVFPFRGTIYFQGPEAQTEIGKDAPEPSAPAESQERESTVTLTGRLKAKPREGKFDRSGHPTAYARFAAHVQGEQGPHIFMATFHRGSANIALNLSKEAQVTVEGYPHQSEDPKRMDTLSVVRFVRYPSRGHKE